MADVTRRVYQLGSVSTPTKDPTRTHHCAVTYLDNIMELFALLPCTITGFVSQSSLQVVYVCTRLITDICFPSCDERLTLYDGHVGVPAHASLTSADLTQSKISKLPVPKRWHSNHMIPRNNTVTVGG